ncbi:MAG TPA: type II secretion system F family protein [Acidimicrobiales bacterium]|jgi:tight adherence protein B
MAHRTRRWGAAAVAAAALLAVAAPAASAAGSGTRVVVRGVDTTDAEHATVTVMVDGERPDPGAFRLTENGDDVAGVQVTPRSTTDAQTGIVLAVDVSSTMDQRGAFRHAKDAAQAFVAGGLPSDRFAIVAMGDTATVVQGFTTDTARLTEAIEDLGPQPGAAIWDGVRKAALLFTDDPQLQANIVVITDGPDTASTTTETQARGAAIDADAAVFTVGIQGGELDTGPYQRMAEETGGRVVSTQEPTELPAMLDGVQRALANQFVLTYASTVDRGPIDLVVEVGGARAAAQAMAGAAMTASAVHPQPVDPPGDAGFLSGEEAKLVGGVLGMAAAALFAYALGSLFAPQSTKLDAALQPYVDGYVDDDGDGNAKLADTKLIQRAVELTGQFAERRGVLARTETALERAMLPLRAAEALFFWFAVVVVAGLAFAVLFGSLIGGLFGVIVATVVPPQFVKLRAKRRRKKFMSQLPDTLQLLSSTLRAGYSLMQGVEVVSQEVAEPMGHELRRVCTEARLGRPLEEALEECSDRMGSPDFAWAVMAIRIQREVGGNLSELLLTVAETMTQRERLRRDVAALTAEGKMSAIVLGILPVGLGLVMWAMSPDYMGVLIEDRLGNFLLGGSTLLALVGFWWMKKTIEIDI